MTDRRISDIPLRKEIVTRFERSWVAIDRGANSKRPFPLYCEILTDKKGHKYIWYKNNTYYFEGGKNHDKRAD